MEKFNNKAQFSIDEILQTHKNIIISVIGPHAGESLDEIFARKIKDIEKCGYTFWISKSRAINPDIIAKFQRENNFEELNILFIKTANNSQGIDTKISEEAEVYEEKGLWKDIDKRLSPLTGRLPSLAFKFDRISIIDEKRKIDLGEYEEVDGGNIQIFMGKSTICVRKSKEKRDMKNGNREIVAFARLASPFCLKVNSKKRLERDLNRNGRSGKKRTNKTKKTSQFGPKTHFKKGLEGGLDGNGHLDKKVTKKIKK